MNTVNKNEDFYEESLRKWVIIHEASKRSKPECPAEGTLVLIFMEANLVALPAKKKPKTKKVPAA